MIELDDLVRRAQTGDKPAFGELYELLAPKIYSYLAYQLHGRVEVAEDLTADVFLKAFHNLNSFTFRDVPFSSWLYRIAHNCVIDHVRAERKRGQTVVLDDVPHLLIERDTLTGSLDRHVLAAALGKLTEKQRNVVLLRVVQGLSIAETAATLGLSEDGVKQLQSRGLRGLKQLLLGKPEGVPAKLVRHGHRDEQPPRPTFTATSRQRHLASCLG